VQFVYNTCPNKNKINMGVGKIEKYGHDYLKKSKKSKNPNS